VRVTVGWGDKRKQDKASQNIPKRGRRRQGKTRQEKAKRGKAKQDKSIFVFGFHFFFTTNRGPLLNEKLIKSQSSSST
jgi:hypothetical protein